MKQHRQEITSADLATWPEFNSTALAPSDRATFAQRRAAIELYAGGETFNKIEDQTHVNRRQLYRLIERCTDILWKFARMNRLPGHMVVSHVARQKVDPYEGFAATAAELDVRMTAVSLGLPQKSIRLAMMRPELRRGWCSHLRFCPRCMSRGYHSVVHQFESVPYCPVHGCRMENVCRSCGVISEYLIKSSVLDAPFKCPNCRSNYGHMSASFVHCIPWPPRDRAAIVRAFIG